MSRNRRKVEDVARFERGGAIADLPEDDLLARLQGDRMTAETLGREARVCQKRAGKEIDLGGADLRLFIPSAV